MKSKITEIINQVSNRTISTDEAIDEILHLFSVINNDALASSEGVAVCCKTCKYVDGFRCNHPQGCETNGDYELWEQQTDL
jgi:hypothetical protein